MNCRFGFVITVFLLIIYCSYEFIRHFIFAKSLCSFVTRVYFWARSLWVVEGRRVDSGVKGLASTRSVNVGGTFGW